MKDTTPQAVQACHELILWQIPQMDKFPRLRRFTLGERLETILLQVLELFVEAAFSRDPDKREALKTTNLRLEVSRHLWRLAHELQVISTRNGGNGKWGQEMGNGGNGVKSLLLGVPSERWRTLAHVSSARKKKKKLSGLDAIDSSYLGGVDELVNFNIESSTLY